MSDDLSPEPPARHESRDPPEPAAGPSRPASRVVESLVIVGSILLAFTIDAGWDAVQESRAERRLLDTIDTEFAAYADELRGTIEDQSERAEAVSWLLSQVGPTRDPDLDEERFWRLVAIPLFTHNPRLDTGALDALVESGGLQLMDDPEVRAQILGWLQVRTRIAELAAFNSAVTDGFTEYLTTNGMTGRINLLSYGRGDEVLRDTPFDLSPHGLLGDPEFEGRLQAIEMMATSMATRLDDHVTYLESARTSIGGR